MVEGNGSDANPIDGDRLTVRVSLDGDRLVEIDARTDGCAGARASAAAVARLARGRSPDAAAALRVEDVLKAVGGLPPGQERCALVAVGALRAALVDARVKVRR